VSCAGRNSTTFPADRLRLNGRHPAAAPRHPPVLSERSPPSHEMDGNAAGQPRGKPAREARFHKRFGIRFAESEVSVGRMKLRVAKRNSEDSGAGFQPVTRASSPRPRSIAGWKPGRQTGCLPYYARVATRNELNMA
jgi:hypothetical protein